MYLCLFTIVWVPYCYFHSLFIPYFKKIRKSYKHEVLNSETAADLGQSHLEAMEAYCYYELYERHQLYQMFYDRSIHIGCRIHEFWNELQCCTLPADNSVYFSHRYFWISLHKNKGSPIVQIGEVSVCPRTLKVILLVSSLYCGCWLVFLHCTNHSPLSRLA